MQGKSLSFFRSLSSQLLVLTIVFVMIVEVFVYVPSLAQFRKNYLNQRLAAAQIAILSLEEADDEGLSHMLEQELLEVAEIQAVIVISEEARELALSSTLPESVSGPYDMRDPGLLELTRDAFMTLKRKGEGSIQIQGEPINPRYQSIQVVLSEQPLYMAMVDFSKSIFFSSLIISFFTGVLIFVTILFLTVRPTKRITTNLTAFERQPEAKGNILKGSGRKNEIGLLEEQISHMQNEIQGALRQKNHLANLGLAVSKINHDLRNILSTAQLSVDLLARKKSSLPEQKTLDRLYRAVDRAVKLCERTLKYGRAEEPAPIKKNFVLIELLMDACHGLHMDAYEDIELKMEIPDGYTVYADKEQVFRILTNLCRNALEAMNQKGTLTISAEPAKKGKQKIRVTDTGPGIPDTFRETLFVPFVGTSKLGGSGLGLAIAHGLAQAHGGDLVLEKSNSSGTVFCISLPTQKG
ncbi:MAG: HAMP domain-containing sensor histidine kinase [Sphingomonadales bacterium]